MPRRENSERNSAIVAMYRWQTLEEIGAEYGLTRERVRQIILKREARSGVRLPRHKASGPRAPRAMWRCAQCGAEREILASAKRRALCWACYVSRKDKRTEEWISARLEGKGWTEIALAAGLPNHQHAHRVPLSIFAYLRRHNRLDEMPQIWRGAATRWLSKRFPIAAIPGESYET